MALPYSRSLARSTFPPKSFVVSCILGLPEEQNVWMSHSDKVIEIPEGFEVIADSPSTNYLYSHIHDVQSYEVNRFRILCDVLLGGIAHHRCDEIYLQLLHSWYLGYQQAIINAKTDELFFGLPEEQNVWMSHSDKVIEIPEAYSRSLARSTFPPKSFVVSCIP
jgi:hypothetical protein